MKTFNIAQSMKTKPKKPWQDTAKEAQEYRDASINRVQPGTSQLPDNLPKNVIDIPSQILSKEDIQITEAPPEKLLGMLASGSLTSTVVITAFLRRASLAQKLVSLDRFGISLLCQLLRLDKLHYRAPPRESFSPVSISR
jgi:hypothetical protein